MYSDPNSVKRISSLGAGPIGGGWTAHFLARGYDVTAYLHDKSETNSFMSILKTAWISLSELGLAPSASMDRLRIVTDLEEALEGADFVQEDQRGLKSSKNYIRKLEKSYLHPLLLDLQLLD
jgi:carnitine 3-dehydrogenase